MATVVGFISEKGGVGKTTVCYHVAIALERFHKKRLLVIDADYQRGGISGRFFPDVLEFFGAGDVPGTTLFHKYQQLYSASALTTNIDVRTWRDRIDVVVADPRLSAISTDKLPGTKNIRENNRLLLEHLRVISDVLRDYNDRYDYILIDTHPEISDVLRSVIYSSQYCVSPVKLDRQSSIGVATIIAEINNVNADVELLEKMVGISERTPDTKFAGAIGTMCREYDGGLKASESLEYNRLRRTGPVFEAYITEGDGLRQAAAARAPVFEMSGANAEKQSQQFRQLTTEFMKRCP